MFRKFITFFGLCVASTSLIAEVARGTVFVDSNENGLLDPGEMVCLMSVLVTEPRLC